MTSNELREFADKIEKVRLDALFESEASMSPESEQFYLLALNMLESANRYAKLSYYAAMQKR